MKCPELHKTHIGQHKPMKQGEGIEGPIHEMMIEIQWNAKLMFFIPPSPQGVWTQFTKKTFF